MTDSYLIDTSAWVEWLRATGSPADLEVDRLLHEAPQSVAVTEPVTMELLSGARSASELSKLEQLTAGLRTVPFAPAIDFHVAAAHNRVTRAAGTPIRSIVRCMIAAVAVRTGIPILHRDRDYEHLAKVVPQLRTRSMI